MKLERFSMVYYGLYPQPKFQPDRSARFTVDVHLILEPYSISMVVMIFKVTLGYFVILNELLSGMKFSNLMQDTYIIPHGLYLSFPNIYLYDLTFEPFEVCSFLKFDEFFDIFHSQCLSTGGCC